MGSAANDAGPPARQKQELSYLAFPLPGCDSGLLFLDKKQHGWNSDEHHDDENHPGEQDRSPHLLILNQGRTTDTMKSPRIPPMLSTIVQAGLVAVDGITFGERVACPVCGGPVSGYDTRKKVFALVSENGRERAIRVTVKRFSCRRCDRIVNADEPFYPGTRIGSPVIDLCLTLATTMPVNRTAAWLDAMDVIVNRTSCRLYREGPCPCRSRRLPCLASGCRCR